ncbi:MAG: hypothetical protein IBJ18_10445 [Phycisphaerales bacterium]|nr:hypothetical protein [Phycisphaerales bacterium]
MNAIVKSVGVVIGVLGLIGGTVIATTAGRAPAQGVGVIEVPDRLVHPMRVERIENLGKEYQLLGKTGKPFGEMSSIVAGISSKRYKGENMLAVVLEVDGRPIDELIEMPISDLWPELELVESKETGRIRGEYRDSFFEGETYRFTGYETGGFHGRPEAAECEPRRVVAEAAMFRFRCEYKVCRSELINYQSDPGARVGRNAFIEGRAENRGERAVIVGEGWSLALTNTPAWKDWELKKRVNAVGVVQRGGKDGEYALEPTRFGLSRLEDMVGKRVKVYGMAYSMNVEQRSLQYRDRRVDVVISDHSKAEGWPFDEAVWVECTVSEKPTSNGDRSFVLNVEKWGKSSALLPQEHTSEPPR